MLRRPVLGGAVDLEDNNEPEEEKPAYQGSFWQRKIIQPIKSVFTQGISPDALALSIAFGITGGIFPIPCTTTIVCGVLIYLFKLNIAACQLFNVLLTPVELMLVLPFIRLGEFIFFSQPLPFSAAELADKLSSNFFGTLSTLGMSFFRAVIAWMLVSFLLTFLLYHALRFILQRTMPKRLMH